MLVSSKRRRLCSVKPFLQNGLSVGHPAFQVSVLEPRPADKLLRHQQHDSMGSRTQYRRKATAVVSYAPPSESDDSVEEPCAGSSTTFSNKPQKGTRGAQIRAHSLSNRRAVSLIPLSPARSAARRRRRIERRRFPSGTSLEEEDEEEEETSQEGQARSKGGDSSRARGRAGRVRWEAGRHQACPDGGLPRCTFEGRSSSAKAPLTGMGISQILSKSSPGELLSLSQVSQGYRSIVTGDNSEALWRQARANYQLPDITSGGFTELQYAGLFFGKGCAACDSNGGAPDFYLRVKLCRTCRHAR